jgi:hypothetical protein
MEGTGTAEGKTKTEIMRCRTRYIAREVFPRLLAAAHRSLSGLDQGTRRRAS